MGPVANSDQDQSRQDRDRRPTRSVAADDLRRPAVGQEGPAVCDQRSGKAHRARTRRTALLLFFVSQEKGGLNTMVNYSNPRVDELYASALIEGDPAKRTAQLAEAQEILAKDVAWLPVLEWKTQWAFNSKIKGIKWHADNSIRWYDLSE